MNTNKTSVPMIIGGILLILYGVIHLFIIQDGIGPVGPGFALYYLAFIVTGIGLISRLLYISIGGAGISALFQLYWAFIEIYDVICYGASSSSLFYIINNLLIGLALTLLTIMMITLVLKKPMRSPRGLTKLWYLPGLLAFAGFAPPIIRDYYWYLFSEGLLFFSTELLCFIVGLFLSGYGLSKASFSAAYPVKYGPGRQVQRQAPAQYGSAPQWPGYGRPPYGNAPQGPGHGRPPYGSAPYGNATQGPAYGPAQGSPATPVRPAGAVTPVTPVVPAHSAQPAAMTGLSYENVETLMKHKQLLDTGIISQAEFDELKRKLLG